ncbi:MAG: hypothetical protein LBR97_10710 [Dysgonamonadaceae bacterium]|jgi:hypothetical protein|nr:hypothetical protein [Dysgonamonadaceae bacterium]
MSPDMPQAGTLAFNPTKAGAFAERGEGRGRGASATRIVFLKNNAYLYSIKLVKQ